MIRVEHLLQKNAWYSAAPQKPTRKLVSATLKKICCEEWVVEFGRRYPHLGGIDFIRQLFTDLDFRYGLDPSELERVPADGPLVIVANHPLGSLDGLALIDMISRVRRDVRAVASRLLWSLKPLRPFFLPVDNFHGRTHRADVQGIYDHLGQGGAILFFPAGEVSRLTPKGVRDGRWNPGFARIAEKAGAPILPVQVLGRNSWWFYGLSALNKPISTLWLVREMFKQASRSIEVRIGHPLEAEHFCSWPLTLRAKAALWRKHVYQLHRSPPPLGPELIAAAEPPAEVMKLIAPCEVLAGQGDLSVHLYRQKADCPVMRELARVREVAFRAVGEGTGQSRDWDAFDAHYDHLLLWDGGRRRIAGAYRLASTEALAEDEIYSSTLFNYSHPPRECLPGSAELGRSFLLPEYWRGGGLDLLWSAIGQWVMRKKVRYLFGPVSMPGTFSVRAKSAIVRYFSRYFAPNRPLGDARLPFPWARAPLPALSGDALADLRQLKQVLREEGVVLPPLFKKYAALTQPGGTSFHAFNIDPGFCDAVDGLVVVDLSLADKKFAKRYLSGMAPAITSPPTIGPATR
ncbi:GNAT family N-acyltransferase [uncultured Microbulbifer sp.]|uniref:lysophospholipid acyltransferase family protein n=1 Tax=uncultured Microbulbifer sp. TaxID=348147 RepID=UPI002605D786|nr:GNAT family N-acyltransferase [uncultured Microbulbifer sp.]